MRVDLAHCTARVELLYITFVKNCVYYKEWFYIFLNVNLLKVKVDQLMISVFFSLCDILVIELERENVGEDIGRTVDSYSYG